MTMNAISVIVPVYNVSLYLRQCIDSILSQSFSDFELILVNDGSTDNSLEICNEYAAKDERVCVIDGPNGGVSVARNKGLDRATGEWIAFADADDYLLEDALQILYDRAKRTGAELVLANSLKLKDGKTSPILRLPNEVLPNVTLSIRHFALWGYLFKREVIKSNNLKFIAGLAYSEDRIFIYQISRYCNTIAFSNKPIYVYRINRFSACSSTNGLRKACHHIDAAYHLRKLAYSSFQDNIKAFNHLIRHSDSILRLGIYQFIEYDMSKIGFSKLKQHYINKYGTGIRAELKFLFYLLRCWITYNRRKIVTFRKK